MFDVVTLRGPFTLGIHDSSKIITLPREFLGWFRCSSTWSTNQNHGLNIVTKEIRFGWPSKRYKAWFHHYVEGWLLHLAVVVKKLAVYWCDHSSLPTIWDPWNLGIFTFADSQKNQPNVAGYALTRSAMIHQVWQYYILLIVCFLCIKFEYACISSNCSPSQTSRNMVRIPAWKSFPVQKLNQGAIGGGFKDVYSFATKPGCMIHVWSKYD